MEDKKRETKRTSSEQIKCYLKFCKENPDIQSRKYPHIRSKKTLELWEELAKNLNRINGPTKTAVKWRESLNNWRHQIRSRQRKGKAKRLATGGDPPDRGLNDIQSGSTGRVPEVLESGHENEVIVLPNISAPSRVNNSINEKYFSELTNAGTENNTAISPDTYSPYAVAAVKEEIEKDENTLYPPSIEKPNIPNRNSKIEEVVLKSIKKRDEQQDQMMNFINNFCEKQLKLQRENNEQLKILNNNFIKLTDKVNNINNNLNIIVNKSK